MKNKKIFLAAQSVLCVLIAVLLCAAAIRIYREGSALQAAGHSNEWIYTREKVIAALSPIFPLFLVSLVMTVFGTVRGIGKKEAEKPVRDTELTRDYICSRVGSPSAEMEKERKLQKKLQTAGRAVFSVCMIPILFYLLNGSHFAGKDPAGLEQAILLLTAFIIPWTAAGLAALSFTTTAMEKSMRRETDAALARMKEEKAASGSAAREETIRGKTMSGDPAFNKIGPGRARRRVLIRSVLLAAAICFTVMGIFNGSMRDVLVKAIRICTECIGLG